MKIYLLRHGETDWSKVGRLQGHTDIPMNEKGILQINTAGEYLRYRCEAIDVIISSPLVRAWKSAEIVADKIGYIKEDIVIEKGFIERSFGMGEGLTLEERNERFCNNDYPNIESIENLCIRAEKAITQCVKKFHDKTILITAHGSILKAVLTSITNGEYPYNQGSTALETGELCVLEYGEDKFNVICAKINPFIEIKSNR